LHSRVPFPPSYTQFVAEFGNARLYRRGTGYLLTVLATPQKALIKDEQYFQFGRSGSSLAYFKTSMLSPDSEPPVFEWHHPIGIRRTAAGFEEWFEGKCRSSRRRFTKDEWARIIQGPAPFTQNELQIVDARRKYRWRIAGVAKNSDTKFEVFNGSEMRLPFLSLGVRGTAGRVDGGIWLPVGDIAPGESGIVEFDCYKKYVNPSEIEVFDLPDPGPEDRETYWELK
jgi:hypothetical protein